MINSIDSTFDFFFIEQYIIFKSFVRILMLFRGQTIDLKFQRAVNWNQLENHKTMAPPAIVSKEIPDIEVSE